MDMAILGKLYAIIAQNGYISIILSFTSYYFVLYSVLRFTRGDLSAIRLITAALILTIAEYVGRAIDGLYCYAFIVSVTGIGLLVVKKEYGISEFVMVTVAYVAVSLTLYAVKGLIGMGIKDDSVSSFVTVASLLVVDVMYRTIRSLAKGKYRKSPVTGVELAYGGKKIRAKGFFDSGNALYRDGVPVAVISEHVARKLGVVGMGSMAVSTITGTKLLPFADIEINLYSDKNGVKSYNSPVVISDKMVCRGYDILLHKDMEVA